MIQISISGPHPKYCRICKVLLIFYNVDDSSSSSYERIRLIGFTTKNQIESPAQFYVEWLVDVQRTTIGKCTIFDCLDNIVQINLKFYAIEFAKYIFMFYNIFIYQNCHRIRPSVATVNDQMLSLHSIMVHIISKSSGVIHLNQIVI